MWAQVESANVEATLTKPVPFDQLFDVIHRAGRASGMFLARRTFIEPAHLLLPAPPEHSA